MAHRLIPFLIGALALAACTSNTETPVVAGSDEPCVTSVTTIPGDEFCPGFDPDAELGSSGSTSEDCPDGDRAAPAGRPDDGWLGTEAPEPHYQFGAFRTPAPIDGHLSIMEEPIERAIAAVPAGFTLVTSAATGEMGCPGPIEISALFADDDGAEIFIIWTTLDHQLEWSNEPVSGEVIRTELDDATEVVANDFGDEGNKHRVWLAKPDGAFVKVVVAGVDAPSQAGWPTTRPTRPDAPTPAQAPLTLDEARQLATALIA
ncbi:MAG: hypothetical protein GY724_09890 [Actinomycetia bacterium]|nr:hypothetical protein [Actinomycetes bacterium]